jgi:hypothetical protein
VLLRNNKIFCAAQKSPLLFRAAHRNKKKYFDAFALLWDDTKRSNCPGRVSFAKARYMKSFPIIFPWGKYSYQILSMGFAGLADIFQVEMGNLMAALEYVRAYIDNLLVITKSSHDDHLCKLEQVFI